MPASLEMPEEKITGKEVRITGINFRPEEKLMKEVQRNASTLSAPLFQPIYKILRRKDVGEKIKEYLQENRYITTRITRIHFGLTPYGSEVAHSFLRERYHGEGWNSLTRLSIF